MGEGRNEPWFRTRSSLNCGTRASALAFISSAIVGFVVVLVVVVVGRDLMVTRRNSGSS